MGMAVGVAAGADLRLIACVVDQRTGVRREAAHCAAYVLVDLRHLLIALRHLNGDRRCATKAAATGFGCWRRPQLDQAAMLTQQPGAGMRVFLFLVRIIRLVAVKEAGSQLVGGGSGTSAAFGRAKICAGDGSSAPHQQRGGDSFLHSQNHAL